MSRLQAEVDQRQIGRRSRNLRGPRESIDHHAYDVRIQVDSNVEDETWGDVFSTESSHPTQVVRPGSLSPGRSYTFSLAATDPMGSIGYTGETSEVAPVKYAHSQVHKLRARKSYFIDLPECFADCLVTHVAEFAFETNAPPVGGYVISDILRMTSGEDKALLGSAGWTDDFDDLPMTYEFGYTHGRFEVLSVSR